MRWLAQRAGVFEASGIRKVFDLGAELVNPINLSIGQPDFDMRRSPKMLPVPRSKRGKAGILLLTELRCFVKRFRPKSKGNTIILIGKCSLVAEQVVHFI